MCLGTLPFCKPRSFHVACLVVAPGPLNSHRRKDAHDLSKHRQRGLVVILFPLTNIRNLTGNMRAKYSPFCPTALTGTTTPCFSDIVRSMISADLLKSGLFWGDGCEMVPADSAKG